MTPPRNPLAVVVGVTVLATELFAEPSMLVEPSEGPGEAALRQLELTDPGVVPSQGAGQDGPRSATEVCVRRVAANAPVEAECLFDRVHRGREVRLMRSDYVEDRPEPKQAGVYSVLSAGLHKAPGRLSLVLQRVLNLDGAVCKGRHAEQRACRQEPRVHTGEGRGVRLAWVLLPHVAARVEG